MVRNPEGVNELAREIADRIDRAIQKKSRRGISTALALYDRDPLIEVYGWYPGRAHKQKWSIEARAKVTDRLRPLMIDGRPVHQIALPFHWGYGGGIPGDAANDLIALSGDPNVTIEEAKAFTCDVRAGRRARSSTAPLRDAHADLHVSPRQDHPAEATKVR